MRTAIFTYDHTSLTIDTPEEAMLEQMGREDRAIVLRPGVNKVEIPRGVFRIVSKAAVRVTGDSAEVEVFATLNNKDAWPDLSKLPAKLEWDGTTIRSFFDDARREPAPR